MIDLSIDQQHAIKQLYKWWQQQNSQLITLGGYAGTGKTTVIALFRKVLFKQNPELRVAFCGYTGKSSIVLKRKLEEAESTYKKDFVGTIHSLIYEPIIDTSQKIVGWKLKKDKLNYDLIIIDEASMVDQTIFGDIRNFGLPIIAVGDHGQLPPIRGAFNLVQDPEIKLNKVHRQADRNPIIKVSQMARETGIIPAGQYGNKVFKYSNLESDTNTIMQEELSNYSKDMMVLCGYNNTRVKINAFVRTNLGFELSEPQVGDRVICLRNNHEKGVFNGMLGTLTYVKESADGNYFDSEIAMDETTALYKGTMFKEQFNSTTASNYTEKRQKTLKGDLFDFGYALTVHKAQGSEAEKVLLFEERTKYMDDEMWKKWLYTAVTRARSELIIFGS